MAYILSKASLLSRVRKNMIFEATTKIISMKNHHYEDKYMMNRTNFRAEQRFKSRDNISNDYNLVYREHRVIVTTVLIVYNGGWISLLATIILIGYFIIKNPPEREKESYMLTSYNKTKGIILLSASLIMCIVIIAISGAMPCRIYHNPKQKLFKAVFTSNMLGNKKILTYTEGTVIPRFTRIKFMTDTLFNINGRTVILDKESFSIPYIHDLMLRSIK